MRTWHDRRFPVALWTAVVVAAGSALAAPDSAPLPIDRVGGGELLWQSEHGLIPLPVVDLQVELRIQGVMLHGRITQRFDNPTPNVINAIYAFPLPPGAAVHRMELQIGDRRIVSVVREREQARRVYEQAKASGRKAALVEQTAGNLFSTSASNINPAEQVAIVLEYVEQVAWSDGSFSLRFPMTYTPRYWPTGSRTAQPIASATPRRVADVRPAQASQPAEGSAGLVPQVRLSVELSAGFPLRELDSHSHPVEVREEHGTHVVHTQSEWIPADRDFELHWLPRLSAGPTAAVHTERRDDGEYALILLLPPAPESDAGLGLPTETVFVVDVSGSMSGPSIVQAREALLAALARLRPEDRFNIVRFNDRHFAFSETMLQAETRHLGQARSWVRELHASGGTEMLPALVRGLELLGRSRSRRAQRLIFLTDGAIGNEDQLLEAVTNQLGGARLHTVAIGHAPNGYLMRHMARLGRGLCTFVSTTATAENAIDRFFTRLDRPVLHDVTLDWSGVRADAVHPASIPDLYAGDPLVLSTRIAGDLRQGEVKISGYSRAGHLERTVQLAHRRANSPGVALRWARAQIDSLMDRLHRGANPQLVRDEVVELGLGFGLVTRYTSRVAVEERATALDAPTTTRIAAALPLGGTSRPLRRAAAAVLLALAVVLWLAARLRSGVVA